MENASTVVMFASLSIISMVDASGDTGKDMVRVQKLPACMGCLPALLPASPTTYPWPRGNPRGALKQFLFVLYVIMFLCDLLFPSFAPRGELLRGSRNQVTTGTSGMWGSLTRDVE
jgi:hypothetical protein